MLTKDVPVILRDRITSFASLNRWELKRTVDVGIKMCDIEPFFEWMKFVVECIGIRSLGWTN
jgi:hypothetical protein